MTEDPIAFAVFNEIGIIDQLAGNAFAKTLPKGMTRAQFTVLNHFVRLRIEEQTPAQLARAFQVTRPTMTSTLQKLARRGLVAIRPDPKDGRGKIVSITDAGRVMREECIAGTQRLAPLMASVASEAEYAGLLPVLRRIRMALDAAR